LKGKKKEKKKKKKTVKNRRLRGNHRKKKHRERPETKGHQSGKYHVKRASSAERKKKATKWEDKKKKRRTVKKKKVKGGVTGVENEKHIRTASSTRKRPIFRARKKNLGRKKVQTRVGNRHRQDGLEAGLKDGKRQKKTPSLATKGPRVRGNGARFQREGSKEHQR